MTGARPVAGVQPDGAVPTAVARGYWRECLPTTYHLALTSTTSAPLAYRLTEIRMRKHLHVSPDPDKYRVSISTYRLAETSTA